MQMSSILMRVATPNELRLMELNTGDTKQFDPLSIVSIEIPPDAPPSESALDVYRAFVSMAQFAQTYGGGGKTERKSRSLAEYRTKLGDSAFFYAAVFAMKLFHNRPLIPKEIEIAEKDPVLLKLEKDLFDYIKRLPSYARLYFFLYVCVCTDAG